MTGTKPLRNPIAAGAENAIERAAGDLEISPVFGTYDTFDQGVERGTRDAGEVFRTFDLCRLRRKERPQTVARRCGHAEPFYGDIEIKIIDPGSELHGIDDPQCGLDAERAEVLDEGHVMRLERGLEQQEFQLHRISVGQQSLAILDVQSGFTKKLRGLAQQRPILS